MRDIIDGIDEEGGVRDGIQIMPARNAARHRKVRRAMQKASRRASR